MDNTFTSQYFTEMRNNAWSQHTRRLLFWLFGFGLIGCLLIFNVTRGSEIGQHFLFRQSIWVLLGLVISTVLFIMPMSLIRRWFFHAAAIWYISLLGLFVLGSRINGARGWYRYGNICLQPAELGKPIFICLLAILCARLHSMTSPWKRFFCQLALYLLCIIPLILQPDWGTALIYSVTFFAVIWYDGIRKEQLCTLSAIGIAFAAIAIFMFKHVRLRLDSFLSSIFGKTSEMGYHALCLQNCHIKGGWTGALFSPTDALTPLPYRYSDSLFASAAELLGAIGVIPIVLLCFGWFIYCCQRVNKEPNPLYQLIILGCGAMITGQVFIHLMVNLGLIPNTGVPLPFFSYGGSSLISTMVMFTIVERLAAKQ